MASISRNTRNTHKKKIENRVQNRQSKIFFLAENSKVTASGITQHEKKKDGERSVGGGATYPIFFSFYHLWAEGGAGHRPSLLKNF